jgi:hypothetical protein
VNNRDDIDRPAERALDDGRIARPPHSTSSRDTSAPHRWNICASRSSK